MSNVLTHRLAKVVMLHLSWKIIIGLVSLGGGVTSQIFRDGDNGRDWETCLGSGVGQCEDITLDASLTRFFIVVCSMSAKAHHP